MSDDAIDPAIALYLAHVRIERRLAPRTLTLYEIHLRALQQNARAVGLALEQVQSAQVRRWMAQLHGLPDLLDVGVYRQRLIAATMFAQDASGIDQRAHRDRRAGGFPIDPAGLEINLQALFPLAQGDMDVAAVVEVARPLLAALAEHFQHALADRLEYGEALGELAARSIVPAECLLGFEDRGMLFAEDAAPQRHGVDEIALGVVVAQKIGC